MTLQHADNRRLFAQCHTAQTVLKTLKTHKISDAVVEHAAWVLGRCVCV